MPGTVKVRIISQYQWNRAGYDGPGTPEESRDLCKRERISLVHPDELGDIVSADAHLPKYLISGGI